jgi:hypothetical protein
MPSSAGSDSDKVEALRLSVCGLLCSNEGAAGALDGVGSRTG